MAGSDSVRFENGVTMGEIERAIETQNYEFLYQAGLPTGVRFAGKTITVSEVLRLIDAARAGAKQ